MTHRTPRNTTRAMQDDGPTEALLFLAQAMTEGAAVPIEAQEATGQRELLNSEVIPADLHGATERDLTALGFVLGPVVDGDPLFRQAQLPDGWRREAGEDPRGSYLLDGLGRRRCSIFYKAAAYDRHASMSVIGIHGYVQYCVYEDQLPVLDEEWAPLERVLAALDEIRDHDFEWAAEFEKCCMVEAAERNRAEASKCAELRAQLEAVARG